MHESNFSGFYVTTYVNQSANSGTRMIRTSQETGNISEPSDSHLTEWLTQKRTKFCSPRKLPIN